MSTILIKLIAYNEARCLVYIIRQDVGGIGFNQNTVLGGGTDSGASLFRIRAGDGPREGNIGSALDQIESHLCRAAETMDKHAAGQFAKILKQFNEPAPRNDGNEW